MQATSPKVQCTPLYHLEGEHRVRGGHILPRGDEASTPKKVLVNLFNLTRRGDEHTSHHRLPTNHDDILGSMPALSMRFLIPELSSKPKTVRRNRVTTSWSLGESRSKSDNI